MMPINFPNQPEINDIFTSNGTTWKYSGVSWNIVLPEDTELTNLTLTGNLTVSGNVVANILLAGLVDVDAEQPLNEQYIRYNSATSKWEATSVSATFNGGTITNPLVINNTGETTGITSGALRVAGGAAVGRNLFVGGTAIIEDEELQMRARSQIKLFNDDNSRFVGFRAPSSVTTDRTYILPGNDGSPGQFLRTNGSGVLSWASAATEAGGTPAGGLTGQVQFNDNDNFAGDSGLIYDQQNQILTAQNLITNGVITAQNTLESTNTASGTVVVSGGLGIAKQLNVGGAVNRFTGGTPSTSTVSGTIVVTGGLGVSGAAHIGSTVSADTAPVNAEHLTNKRYVDANVLAFSVAFGA